MPHFSQRSKAYLQPPFCPQCLHLRSISSSFLSSLKCDAYSSDTLALIEKRNGEEVTYEIETSDEVKNFLETKDWLTEFNNNIIHAYTYTMNKKEEGQEIEDMSSKLFDLKIQIKERKDRNEIWTHILSRKQLDNILCEFTLAQMNEYRKLNDAYLEEVGKLTEKFLSDIAEIAKNQTKLGDQQVRR